ncbi:MAG: Na+/H+ antiporter [Gemmatimonadetes bacterium]|jgi:CPA1 family monovalent cation:H+ antiporter|nr:Na+/H+ antiporter [Gemmatimonadota bacterium]
MPQFEPVIFAITVAALVVALSALARRLPVPTPILQVTAGFLVALIPGIATPDLDPDVIFFVFLPPILWAAAMFTSVREFKRNAGPIAGLAIGLVLVTTVAVALAARALLPGLPWAMAIALGAIISPPDAVAATAIVSRLPVPRRVITVLEGESLVNDATALVIYRTAVAAAVTGAFSWGESIVRFFIDAGVGVLIGLLVSWLVLRAIRWTHDALAETLLTVAAPYVAWLGAESLHVSAVLACVAGGIYLQQHLSTAVGPASRLQTRTVWDLLIFLLNAMIFLLLGAQFVRLLELVPNASLASIIGTGAVITAVAVGARLAWVPFATFVARGRVRRDPARGVRWQPLVLISWTSMRGVISLATALALPRVMASGAPLPYRTEIILIAMSVIVLTLLVQGLTLGPLVRFLGFAPEQTHHEEERLARHEAARRGAEALEDLSHEDWSDPRDVAALRAELRERAMMLGEEGGSFAGRRRLRLGMIAAERRMLVRLRNEDAISDEVLRALELELDLEAVRVGAGEAR